MIRVHEAGAGESVEYIELPTYTFFVFPTTRYLGLALTSSEALTFETGNSKDPYITRMGTGTPVIPIKDLSITFRA